MSDANDDLNRSFDFDDHDDDAATDAFAQQVFAAMHGSSSSGETNGEDNTDSSATNSNSRTASDTSASRTNASRLLEALEQLSHESGGDGIPQSLRGLLGQLHSAGDSNNAAAMHSFFPFVQLLDASSHSSSSPRFQRTLDAIQLDAPPHVQLSGLSDLLETLAMSSEDVLVMTGFRVDKFVPACVALVATAPTMDVLVLAARALASMLELFPATATPRAIADGIVPALCAKLLDLEYMDVAELALQVLERLVCPSAPSARATSAISTGALATGATPAATRRAVLEQRGIVALLQFVDFFPLALQRTAARIAAALCTDYPLALVPQLRESFALLVQLLASFDAAIVESATDAMQHLVESAAFSASPALAALVASDAVCTAMLELLAAHCVADNSESVDTSAAGPSTRPQLAPRGYVSILRFFAAVLASTVLSRDTECAARVTQLRFAALPPLVTQLLAREAADNDHELLRDTLKLVIVLLPSRDELVQLDCSDNCDNVLAPVLVCAHASLGSLICVYDATARSDLRYECLGVLNRSVSLVYARAAPFSASERTELAQLAAFLARVLRPKTVTTPATTTLRSTTDEADALPVHLALQIVDASLAHVHASRSLVLELFERHGVATAIRFYAATATATITTQDSITDHADASATASIGTTVSPPARRDPYEVVAASTRLVETYVGAASAATSRVVQLKTLVDELECVAVNMDAPVDSTDATTQSPVAPALVDVLTRLKYVVLHGPADVVTAHELACSGLVAVLTHVLQSRNGAKAFTRVFLTEEDDAGTGPSAAAALRALVECIQDAIASEKDAFAASSASAASNSVSRALEQLTQHVKVRVLIDDTSSNRTNNANTGNAPTPNSNWFLKHALRRSASSDATRPASTGAAATGAGSNATGAANLAYVRNRASVHDTVVLVEPLARIEAMEQFVVDKLFGARRGGATSMLDELTGDDDDDRDDDAATALEREHKHDDDGDDDAHCDQDDGSTARKAPRAKRVQAFYNGERLCADVSILEAIVKTTGDDVSPDDTFALDRIWATTPHELTFRVLLAASAVDAVDATKDDEASNSTDASTVTTNAAVVDSNDSVTLQASKSPLEWWDNVWDLLALLAQVRALVLAQPPPSALSRSPILDKSAFTNAFLSLQVTRVLQQPVRVVTNALPAWSFRVVQNYAFVLDAATRYDFAYVTSCGSARAIQHLCRSVWQRAVLDEPLMSATTETVATLSTRRRTRPSRSSTDASSSSSAASAASRTAALTTIARMVKLPRLKVRVARTQLLASARKLLAIYGGKRAVIEIEFLGEVGTGLGPTTEFYTLVCQEIQAKRLRMWRDDDDNGVRSSNGTGDATKNDNAREHEQQDVDALDTVDATTATLPQQSELHVRGYHRIAVFHCSSCRRIHVPHCSDHNILLTHAKHVALDVRNDSSSGSTTTTTAQAQVPAQTIAQCAQCLDAVDWHTLAATQCIECGMCATVKLHWWILSNDEAQYLDSVFPHQQSTAATTNTTNAADATNVINAAATSNEASVRHPVLQCKHCATVNFPGTDAGIVTLARGDDHRMLSRTGRRMYERDYRAVTKHVSPLCEGTPLRVTASVWTRRVVDTLVSRLAQSPEVLERDVDAYWNDGDNDAATHDRSDWHSSKRSSYRISDTLQSPAALVTAPRGLYPRMYPNGLVPDDVLAWFAFLGRVVAQAMLDERLLNVPFARPFVRKLRGETLVGETVEVALSLAFVAEWDVEISNSLAFVWELAQQAAAADATNDFVALRHASDTIDAMALPFTLVGDDAIELCENGALTLVTSATAATFVKQTLHALLATALDAPAAAFARGFAQICGAASRTWLHVLDVDALERIIGDRQGTSLWDRDGTELRAHVVCAHGFAPSSRAIADLIAVLCAMDVADQRLFVRFVTGANRLPVGGLAQLDPKLTVVRKGVEAAAEEETTTTPADEEEEEDEASRSDRTKRRHARRAHGFCSADAVLPSASTCTNYLKLPSYSTRDVLQQRLLFCIREGQGSFHLS